jgi:hypothetical protein
LIRDQRGVLRPETFRVDSGTEVTSMAAARAKALDLPIPRKAIFLDVHGIKREVRSGLIRIQIVGMDGDEYVFPCYFLGSPDAASGPGQLPALARNLLGLTGVVDKLRIIFDGTPSSRARHGMMVVEKV